MADPNVKFDSPAIAWGDLEATSTERAYFMARSADSLEVSWEEGTKVVVTRWIFVDTPTSNVGEVRSEFARYHYTLDTPGNLSVEPDIRSGLVWVLGNSKMASLASDNLTVSTEMEKNQPWISPIGFSFRDDFHGEVPWRAQGPTLVDDSSIGSEFTSSGYQHLVWNGGKMVCHDAPWCQEIPAPPTLPNARFVDSYSLQGYSVMQLATIESLLVQSLEWSIIGEFSGRLQNVAGPLCEQTSCNENDALRLSGSMAWLGLRSNQENRMSAEVTGTVSHARLDNQNIDPSDLGLLVAGAASVSVIAVMAIVSKLGAFGLFTRLKPEEALEHPRRQRLYAYIQENPGATFREVVRETNIPTGTTRHHLNVLRRSDLIVEKPHKATLRFFENHGKYDQSWDTVVMLREEPLKILHEFLGENPSTKQKDIVDAMASMHGWSRGTTQHRIGRLEDAGLVSHRPQGRLKLYTAHATPLKKPEVQRWQGLDSSWPQFQN